jgi:hypothetical protein
MEMPRLLPALVALSLVRYAHYVRTDIPGHEERQCIMEPNRAPYRPALVMVAAILNIILGALSVFSGLYLGVHLLTFDPARIPRGSPQYVAVELQRQMEEHVPGNAILTPIAPFLVLFVGTLLIVDGIGLIRVQQWARRVCIGYAVYLIGQTVLSTIYNLIWVFPVMQRWADDYARNNPPPAAIAAMGAKIGMYLGLFFGILYIAYAIFLLVVMFQPHVKAAFAGEPPPLPPTPEELYDRRMGL